MPLPMLNHIVTPNSTDRTHFVLPGFNVPLTIASLDLYEAAVSFGNGLCCDDVALTQIYNVSKYKLK